MNADKQPLIIVGAGIAGLTLAQACRKENIPFRIFERDEHPSFRSAGWGLTLNWALPTFRSLLPEDVLSRLPETYVNKAAVDAGEKGSFTFFDLSTGAAKWKVPASERIRVSRERLRKLLLTGLDVEWNKALKDISKDDVGVEAHFADGTSAKGFLLVACDGANSIARQRVHPENSQNHELPVRFIGAGVVYPESKVSEIRKLDPFFLQGSDPRSDAYLWFSFLEVPGDPDAPSSSESGEQMYRCQVVVSWPYREGFFGRAEPSSVPNTSVGQRSWMKALSEQWAEPFKSIVQNIPRDSEIKPVELADWVPQRNSAGVLNRRAVLLGDAMHTMVMYRGEGANHAIVDVGVLLEQIRPLFSEIPPININEFLSTAVANYDTEVIERTELAVLASRRACLDAHDFRRLGDNSPLVKRRVMRLELQEMSK